MVPPERPQSLLVATTEPSTKINWTDQYNCSSQHDGHDDAPSSYTYPVKAANLLTQEQEVDLGRSNPGKGYKLLL
jgi:hypothetical protein